MYCSCDLLFIGCEKLGIVEAGCQVVDERDGSIIDEDDVIQEMKGKAFLLLESGDV